MVILEVPVSDAEEAMKLVRKNVVDWYINLGRCG